MTQITFDNGTKIEFSEAEWELLRKHIITDTLNFWETVSKDIDDGILPMELAFGEKQIDREVLASLKNKLNIIL